MSADFRSTRIKLPPEAFAIQPEQPTPPTDLIDEHSWAGIVHLADDVSIFTSDHHGTLFQNAYELWGLWVALVLDLQSLLPDPSGDALALSCFIVTDELQSSAYAALTGFYRQAIGELRQALEGILAGVFFRAFPDRERFRRWADGDEDRELQLSKIRNSLQNTPPYNLFKDGSGQNELFGKDSWVGVLYKTLSRFGHGRPAYIAADG